MSKNIKKIILYLQLFLKAISRTNIPIVAKEEANYEQFTFVKLQQNQEDSFH